MNENSKTIVFVAVACVAVLLAFVTKPRFAPVEQKDLRGEQLFPDFNDALAATGIEIVKYDEKTATVQPFKVEQVDGLWSIPSHDNYPADAKDQLADVAADMVDLTVLEEASDSRGDQALYGVIDPDPNTLKAGDTGVGIKVAMWGKDKKELMALIIGKQVPDRDELHYVRKPGQDQVYVVKVDTEKLTTKFKSWIEEDLLKLNPFDIETVDVFDYSVDEMNGNVIQRGRFVVDYNDTEDPRWKLAEDYKFDGKDWVPEKAPADQELNTEKLSAMKTALDDLKIVDVAKKPGGLSADLRADKGFMDNEEARRSLESCGFYVARMGDDLGLFSNEGEMRVRMKDGVEYVLRFGEIAAGTGSVDDEKKKADEEKKETGSGLNRYLFVMAEFNADAIAKPDLEPLPLDKPGKPVEKPKAEPAAAKPVDAKPEAAKAPEAKPADGEKETVVKKPVEEKADVEKPQEEKPAADDASKKEPEKKSEPAKEPEADAKEPKAEAKSTEAKPADDKKADEKAAAPVEKKPAEEVASAEDLKAERERIEKDNKRKEAEYQEKIQKGKERVKELNDRFADWYYVISDEVYQKIHITRADLFKPKEKKESADGKAAPGGFTPGALDQLRKGLPK